jgi:hypothetical protein
LRRIGVDEQRHAYAGLRQTRAHFFHPAAIRCYVQTAFGRELFAPLGYETAIVWLNSAGDLQHLIGGSHFQVEARGDDAPNYLYVAILNVPAVFAQMYGDRIRAALLGLECRLRGIGVWRSACLAQRRDVIDVNAQSYHPFASATSPPARGVMP